MAISIISEIQQMLSTNPKQRLWLGIDVHKRSYYVAAKIGDNPPLTWSTQANPQNLVNSISAAGIKPYGICYEAGPTGFSLARAFKEADIPVIVAAPNKILRSVSPGSKTDKLDCIKLATFASKGLINPIAIPSIDTETNRTIIRRRHKLTDEIRKCKQRIKAMFLYHGYPEPLEMKYWSKDCGKVILNLEIPPSALSYLKSLFREYSFLKEERLRIDKKLREISHKVEHAQIIDSLMTVPGIGFITAMTFHLELFKPERFKRPEEVASYLGLSPTIKQSGERNPKGYLIRVGQQRLRSLLVESSWVWIANDDEASNRYRKILSKTGIPQKAISAMARRLAIILWRISIEKRAYYSKEI